MANVDQQIVRGRAVLKAAPKAVAGGAPRTRVTVKAYDIASQRYPWLKPFDRYLPDHMYVEYEDGRETLIARGGPTATGPDFKSRALRGDLRTNAVVLPAQDSVDNGRGTRVLSQTFIPGRTAREAAKPAYEQAARINRAQNLYGGQVNSNSYVGDVMEDTTGQRVGDRQTWGFRTRLQGGGMSPTMVGSRKALGAGFGSTAPGMFLYRLGEELGKRSPNIPMLPGY